MNLPGNELPLDFILYIGDDGQTEQVFKYLNRMQTKQRRLIAKKLQAKSGLQPASPLQQRTSNLNVSPDINVYTCTIGKRATQAKYYVPGPS